MNSTFKLGYLIGGVMFLLLSGLGLFITIYCIWIPLHNNNTNNNNNNYVGMAITGGILTFLSVGLFIYSIMMFSMSCYNIEDTPIQSEIETHYESSTPV